MRSCHYCSATDRETRPYGPGGARVCFECAMLPANVGATEQAYAAQLTAASAMSPDGVVVLTADGPHPYVEQGE